MKPVNISVTGVWFPKPVPTVTDEIAQTCHYSNAQMNNVEFWLMTPKTAP